MRKLLFALCLLFSVTVIPILVFNSTSYAETDTTKTQLLQSKGYNLLDSYRKGRLQTYLYTTGFISDAARTKVYSSISTDNYFTKSDEEQRQLLVNYLEKVFPYDYSWGKVYLTYEPYELKDGVYTQSYYHWGGKYSSGYCFVLTINQKHTVNIFAPTNDKTVPNMAAKALAGFPYEIRKNVKTIYYEPSSANQFNGSNADIWIRTANPPGQDSIEHSFAHELGHVMMNNVGNSDSWNNAKYADMTPVSGYATWFPDVEDVSEFYRLYYRVHNDSTLLESLKKIYPNRYIEFMNMWNRANPQVPTPTIVVPSKATGVVAKYAFNETSGLVVKDSSGYAVDGLLETGCKLIAGKNGNSIKLDGTEGYAKFLPEIAQYDQITVAAWIRMDATANWSRVFDFGAGQMKYMCLIPSADDGMVRFSITKNGRANQEKITTTSQFPVGIWTHVALTLSGSTGVIYINGKEVGRNSSMTIKPSDLGVTASNYVGKSQYSDPYFNGQVDDFVIYNYGLSKTEIEFLYQNQQNQQTDVIYGDASGDGKVDSADYTLLRRYLLGIITTLPAQNWMITCDVNKDKLIDSADFTLVRKYLIGKVGTLPVT